MFAKRLAQMREKSGLTQEEISKKLGIARTTYQGYENGPREPDYDTLVKIADFHECSIDYLTGRTDDPSMNKKEKINKIIDLSDENVANLEFILDEKPLTATNKNKAIRILREVLRIEVQEEGR